MAVKFISDESALTVHMYSATAVVVNYGGYYQIVNTDPIVD